MQLGLIGLGRMGGNMARRLMAGGHDIVGWDHNPPAVDALRRDGAAGAASLDDFVGQLAAPRAVWLMVPAGDATESTIAALAGRLAPGDTVIDGGTRPPTIRRSRSSPAASPIRARGAGRC